MKNIIKSILLIILLVISTSCKSTSNKELNYDNFDLAVMVEDEKGQYTKWNNVDWPDENDYALNTALSTCEDKNTIKWDDEKGAVYLTSNNWDKCIAKFDKIIKIKYIEDLVELSNRVNEGDSLKGRTVKLMRDLDFKNTHANGSNEIAEQLDFDNMPDEEKNKIPDYRNVSETKYNDFNKDGKNNTTIMEELTNTEGAGFVPIGKESKIFEGNFDGNNHTISNLYINNTTNLTRLGLFGEIGNSTMKDITIKGEIKTKTKAVSGGLVGGANKENNTIENVINYVNVTSESNGNDSAGIIGGNYGNTVIKNCKN